MSRHLIDGLNPRHLVYVGWNPPLSTYFGQVYDPGRGEDENPIYWIGTDRAGQFPEVAELVKAMAKYAVVRAEMIRTLFHDKELDR